MNKTCWHWKQTTFFCRWSNFTLLPLPGGRRRGREHATVSAVEKKKASNKSVTLLWQNKMCRRTSAITRPSTRAISSWALSQDRNYPGSPCRWAPIGSRRDPCWVTEHLLIIRGEALRSHRSPSAWLTPASQLPKSFPTARVSRRAERK